MHALNVHVAYTRPSLAKPNLNSRHLQGLQPGHTKEMGDGLTSQMGDRVRMAAVGMSVPKSVRSSLHAPVRLPRPWSSLILLT